MIEFLRLLDIYFAHGDSVVKGHAIGVRGRRRVGDVLVCVLADAYVLAAVRACDTALRRLLKGLHVPSFFVADSGALPTLVILNVALGAVDLSIIKGLLAVPISQLLVPVNYVLDEGTGRLRALSTQGRQFGYLTHLHRLLLLFQFEVPIIRVRVPEGEAALPNGLVHFALLLSDVEDVVVAGLHGLRLSRVQLIVLAFRGQTVSRVRRALLAKDALGPCRESRVLLVLDQESLRLQGWILRAVVGVLQNICQIRRLLLVSSLLIHCC